MNIKEIVKQKLKNNILPNGNQLLKCKECEGGFIVLSLKNDNEFVTHFADKDFSCYGGHYFLDSNEAERDYENRT